NPNLLTGIPGTGKTTLSLNLAVAIAAGVLLLGAETMPMSVFLLMDENDDGVICENLKRVCHGLGVDPASVIGSKIDWLSTKGKRLPGGPWLTTIDDGGKSLDTRFFTECIVPKLRGYAGPLFFVIDPL